MLKKIKKELGFLLIKYGLNIIINDILILDYKLQIKIIYNNILYVIIFKALDLSSYYIKTNVGVLVYMGDIGNFKYGDILLKIICHYFKKIETDNNIITYNNMLLLLSNNDFIINNISYGDINKLSNFIEKEFIILGVKKIYINHGDIKSGYMISSPDGGNNNVYFLEGIYLNKDIIDNKIFSTKKMIKELNGYSNNLQFGIIKGKEYITIRFQGNNYYYLIYKYIDNQGLINSLMHYNIFDELIRLNKYKIGKGKHENLIGYIHGDPHIGNFLKDTNGNIIIIDYEKISRNFIILQPLLLFIKQSGKDNINYNDLKIILLYFCINIDGLIYDLNNIDIFMILKNKGLNQINKSNIVRIIDEINFQFKKGIT